MKYEVIKSFRDKYDTSIKYKIGDIIDITQKRAKEILKVDELIKKVEE